MSTQTKNIHNEQEAVICIVFSKSVATLQSLWTCWCPWNFPLASELADHFHCAYDVLWNPGVYTAQSLWNTYIQLLHIFQTQHNSLQACSVAASQNECHRHSAPKLPTYPFIFNPTKKEQFYSMTKMKTLLYSRNHNFLSCMMNASFFLGGLPTSLPASAEISLPQNHSPLITPFLSGCKTL